MRAVIIYDNSGEIHAIKYGELNLPVGLRAISADIPENVDTVRMEGDKPVFDYLSSAPLDHYNEQLASMTAQLENAKNAVNSFVQILSENITDEQASLIKSMFPEWSGDGVEYRKNQRVHYRGEFYRVIMAHKSQDNWTPNFSPSLFSRIIEVNDSGVILDWQQPDSTNAYKEGDRVMHNGKTYISLANGNVWEPGVAGSKNLWQEVDE